MASQAEIEAKLWKALKSDRVVMLGLAGVAEGHAKPMSAQIEGEEGGPIWFFTAKDTDFARELGTGGAALIHFAAKGHDLFATIEGRARLTETLEKEVMRANAEDDGLAVSTAA